ncbi:MAG TPA: GTPase Era [Cyclobacteriaceae bacterium]|nr:GTPase Era [Cyclobacteriaceae bacterium]
MEQKTFKSGFVSIVGKPNVGKSTLMNKLVGENLSIISPKAQTTRHRIMGMINGENYQIIYSDTPGLLEPKYTLHQAMMNYVKVSLEDADLILLMVELGEKYDPTVFDRFNKMDHAIILVINKCDKAKGSQVDDKVTYWKEHLTRVKSIIPVSALKGDNIQMLLTSIVENIPEHPPYFPTDELTDRPERFFASEILREKIFLNYEQEVPYSTEVVITDFKDDTDIIRIRAEIYVERDSQKGIIIGKGGASLKKVGSEARVAMENFFQKKIFLETHVKVAKDWRKERNRLRQFGYFE